METTEILDEGRTKTLYSPNIKPDQEHLVISKIVFGRGQSRKSREPTRWIKEGLPTNSVSRLIDHLGITQTAGLSLLSLNLATFTRRKAKGRLEPTESDRVYRYARLVSLAMEMFHGDEKSATNWLRAPAYAFNDETPLEHAKTEYGAHQVEQLIGRIRHGIPT